MHAMAHKGKHSELLPPGQYQHCKNALLDQAGISN